MSCSWLRITPKSMDKSSSFLSLIWMKRSFSQKLSVRSGIRTHASKWRPERPWNVIATMQGIEPWVWRLRPLGHPDGFRRSRRPKVFHDSPPDAIVILTVCPPKRFAQVFTTILVPGPNSLLEWAIPSVTQSSFLTNISIIVELCLYVFISPIVTNIVNTYTLFQNGGQ